MRLPASSQPGSNSALLASRRFSWRGPGARTRLSIPLIDLSSSRSPLWLRPPWYPEPQERSQTPPMSRQPGRPCRRPRLPTLAGTRLGERFEFRQGHAQARVGPHEGVLHLEERQLLTHSGFVVAQGGAAPTDRRHRRAKIQVEAFDKARVDRPPALGQNRLDGLCRAAADAVLHPHDPPAPIGFGFPGATEKLVVSL